MMFDIPNFGNRVCLADIRSVQAFRVLGNCAWFSVLFVGNKHFTTYEITRGRETTDERWAQLCAEAETAYSALLEAWTAHCMTVNDKHEKPTS